MLIKQPTHLTFWHNILLTFTISPFLAIWQLIHFATELDVVALARNYWMGPVVGSDHNGICRASNYW